jgi:hypothetical protein
MAVQNQQVVAVLVGMVRVLLWLSGTATCGCAALPADPACAGRLAEPATRSTDRSVSDQESHRSRCRQAIGPGDRDLVVVDRRDGSAMALDPDSVPPRSVLLSIAGDVLRPEPAGDVVDQAGGEGDVGVASDARRLEPTAAELAGDDLDGNAVLEGDADHRGPGVHEAADGTALLGDLAEDFTGAAVGVQADGHVELDPADGPLVGEGLAGVGEALAAGGRKSESIRALTAFSLARSRRKSMIPIRAIRIGDHSSLTISHQKPSGIARVPLVLNRTSA